MLSSRRIGLFLTVALYLSTTGCATPDAVSKFCTTSNTTLTSAITMLGDLQASCLRRKNLEKGIGAFAVVQDDPECDKIGAQGDAAAAAAQLLADYFTAINSLATVGTTSTSTDAMKLLSQSTSAAGLDSDTQNALSSIAQLLTTAATNGYQQRQLANDLSAVSKNIDHVTDALIRIIHDFYLDQLKREHQKLATRYKEFAQSNPSGEVMLQLDDRWHTDEQAIVTKQDAAETLITALKCIKKGADDLAASGHSLKAKQLPALLGPYIAQLQTLIPQIQKAF